MTNKPTNMQESHPISGDFSQDKSPHQEPPVSDLEARVSEHSSETSDSLQDHLSEKNQGKKGGKTAKAKQAEQMPPVQSDQEVGAQDAGSDHDSDALNQLKDQLLRAMAEMENLRRRSARELADRVKYAPGELARDLLPVADNLDRALSSLDAEARAADERLEQFAAGIEAIARDFLAAFEKNGIHRLDPLDQPFNPSEHEAMLKVQDDSRPPGTVVQVMQAGYILRDRLLRPAMVGVAEGGAPPTKVDEKA